MNPVQCATGLRIATIMRRLGIQDDQFESFILSVYNRCYNELGLRAERIGFHITNLAKLSDTISPLQIPNYILQKTDEKNRLEEKIKELENKIEELQNKKYEFERLTACAIDNHRITNENLKWYTDIKEELEKKYGIPASDISKFAKAVDGISQMNYNVSQVIQEFSNLDSARRDYSDYKKLNTDLEIKYNYLNQECSKFQQKISLCSELDHMGFGLKELKLLRNGIREIAAANNIPKNDAVKLFFKDVEENYDDKLEFESKKQRLQEEINKLNQRKLKLFLEANMIPQLAALVVKLSSIDGNNNTEEFDLLVDQVRKAGGIRGAIRKLAGSSTTDHGSSSTDLTLNDKGAVVLVNNHDQNDNSDNNSTNTEKGKDEQSSNEKDDYDDPMFKQWINEVTVLFKYLAPKIAELKQPENHL
jgi:phage shock protein A